MRTQPLGSSGIEASVVALGAWALGGWMWGGVDERDAENAVHAALDSGINFIDTAPVYGFGRSEKVIGRALRGGRRHHAVIAGKCSLSWDETAAAGVHHFDSSEERIVRDAGEGILYRVYRYARPAAVRKGVEDSLRRLGTDHIDLMQTHWQDPGTPIEDTMGELLRLKKEGKIRAIGCSNATPADMDRYRSLGPLDADQEKYGMLDRGMEESNLPYCAEHKIAFLAYSPLAQGLLTGKIDAHRVFPSGDQRAHKPRFSQDNRRKVNMFLAAVKPVADAYNLSLAQLAAAWALSGPGCTHVLLGARNARQVVENAGAGDVVLEDAALGAIAAAMAEFIADVE